MRSFFAELRRRNVYRAAVFYAASAWLLVQVATQVFPFFSIPNWVVRLIVVAVIVGFPLALLFSWFYEWTPEGIRREAQIDRSQSVTRATGKKLDRWIIAVLAMAVVLLVADKFVLHRDVAAVAEKSIAVLPFANTSGDAGNEYFSDGLAQELISSLSRLSDLKVIGRTSSFQFKGKGEDSKSIGDKLGVFYLLDGSVRNSAESVRLAIELVKAADGTNVWSESYDRELKDIFAVQTEIAGAVAAQLKVALLGNNAQSVQALPESTPSNQNVEAYSALLQGRFYEQRRTAEDQRKAIEYYQEAIRLDPKYALAYAHMSRAKTRLIAVFTVSESERAQLIAEMREAADTALALQPDLGVAHQARAAILQLIDLDVAASESEFRRAAELDPQETQTALSLGILNSSNGRLAEGVAYGTKATVLDPLNSTAYVYLSRTLVALGRYDEAEAVLRKGIELQPQAAQSYCEYSIVEILRGNPAAALKLAKQETDAFWRMFALALAHFANGNKTEADAELESLIAEYADSGAFQIAMVYALRKEPDKVFEWLDHGFVTHDPGVTTVRYAAFLNAYSADPRFAAFCKKLGLSPPQQGTQSRAMPEPAGNTPSIERKS